MTHPSHLPIWRRLKWPAYLAMTLLLGGVIAWVSWGDSSSQSEVANYQPPSPQVVVTTPEPMEQAGGEVVSKSHVAAMVWRDGSFKQKPFFNQLLDEGLTGGEIQNLIAILTPVYNFRKARSQHHWRLALRDGKAEAFTLEVSPTEIYDIANLQETPVLSKRVIETFVAQEVIRGEITGSLFQSLDHVRKPMRLGLKLADVFAWDIDFNRDPQNEDKFEILVEARYIHTPQGPEFHGYGEILAARYHARKKTYQAVLFSPKGGERGYYNQVGESLIRDVLRSPLKVQIVTSRFQRSRFHPILKKNRPHNGVDYRAKRGTPVMAVADGKVHRAGRSGGAGIMVELKHKDRMLTQYFHLSRIAKGVRSGSRVRQGQVIGFVGKTGYATANHLHFGMKIRGKYVDPFRQKFQPGTPIKKSQMAQFRNRMAELMVFFDPEPGIQEVLGLAPDIFDQFSDLIRAD